MISHCYHLLLLFFFSQLCRLNTGAIVEVKIQNMLEQGRSIQIHCQSKDDDIGNRRVENGDEMQWSFNPNIWDSTLFFCDVQWENSVRYHFDAYDEKRDWERCIWECRWVIAEHGELRGYDQSSGRWEVFPFEAHEANKQGKNNTVLIPRKLSSC